MLKSPVSHLRFLPQLLGLVIPSQPLPLDLTLEGLNLVHHTFYVSVPRILFGPLVTLLQVAV